jgi:hypothetical protein
MRIGLYFLLFTAFSLCFPADVLSAEKPGILMFGGRSGCTRSGNSTSLREVWSCGGTINVLDYNRFVHRECTGTFQVLYLYKKIVTPDKWPPNYWAATDFSNNTIVCNSLKITPAFGEADAASYETPGYDSHTPPALWRYDIVRGLVELCVQPGPAHEVACAQSPLPPGKEPVQ